MSVGILRCEWQKSVQTGFFKESASCAGFQDGSSVYSIFRNLFILGLLSPWSDKIATVGKLNFPPVPKSGQSLMSHLVTCPLPQACAPEAPDLRVGRPQG